MSLVALFHIALAMFAFIVADMGALVELIQDACEMQGSTLGHDMLCKTDVLSI